MVVIIVTGIILILAFIFSMLGLGGAMLYIPVMHWFGYGFKEVIGIGLLLNGITVLSASTVYWRSKMIDIKGSIPLVLSSFVGAPLGAYFTKMVPTKMLILLFAIAMLFAGIRMLFTASRPDKETMMEPGPRIFLMGAGGFIIGAIAGLLGVGGGFLFVPLMLMIGYPTKRAAATSAFAVIFSSFSGFAGHMTESHFNFILLIVTAIAVIIGAWLGAQIMRDRMKAQWIKQMFGVVLTGVGIQLILKLYI